MQRVTSLRTKDLLPLQYEIFCVLLSKLTQLPFTVCQDRSQEFQIDSSNIKAAKDPNKVISTCYVVTRDFPSLSYNKQCI